MSIKKPLEQPIFNAIIHHAYMLRDDEREVLLRAFLEMSYQIHREAVEIMAPEEDIGGLIAAYTQFEEPLKRDAFPEPATPAASGEATAAAAYCVTAKTSDHHESAIAKGLQSFRQMLRRRESVLQEEEELALFSTIEGVADLVNREAMEQEIMGELKKGDTHFAAAYERDGKSKWDGLVVSESPGETWAGERKKKRQQGLPFDSYIECMDEELYITRGIIERNRVLSQDHLKARAM